MSTTEAHSESRTQQVFLIRGVIAIAWAATCATVTDSLTFGVGVLLVAYPLIDAVASLADTRNASESALRLLLANAATSVLAAVGLGIAATGSIKNVLAVFGVWAVVSGAAQLTTAVRRRALLGKQWPMLAAGCGSVLFGIGFIIASTKNDPKLSMLAIYAGTGGVDFLVQAWLIQHRRHHSAARPLQPLAGGPDRAR